MMPHYILDGREPKRCDNLLQWARWMEDHDRVVARTKIDEILVSTVFLGLDHNFDGGTPILFETMVFGGPLNEHMVRYTGWKQALAGHQRVLEQVQSAAA